MKKLISATLALAMMLTLFAGCGKKDEPTQSGGASSSGASTSQTEEAMPTLEDPAKIDAVEFVGGPSNGGWAMISAALVS